MLEHAKVVLSNQAISSEISEAWDSHSMLEHAKVVLSNQAISSEISEAWDSQAMLRTCKGCIEQSEPSLLRYQRHGTHILCWNIQRLY
jgi:hypothetical protein